MSRDPRVIADEAWAKLIWAGLNLQEADLPIARGGTFGDRRAPAYPLAMIKALAVTWLFAGLRVDELVRLRVGCTRWQNLAGGPGAAMMSEPGAACLLDVPVHKTGSSYTKPVDPVVGTHIAEWEAARPNHPRLPDPKTGELASMLFCWRGRLLPGGYINRSLIPALCRKAGVPETDARGRITGHRARHTIASHLYNAKEPMTAREVVPAANPFRAIPAGVVLFQHPPLDLLGRGSWVPFEPAVPPPAPLLPTSLLSGSDRVKARAWTAWHYRGPAHASWHAAQGSWQAADASWRHRGPVARWPRRGAPGRGRPC